MARALRWIVPFRTLNGSSCVVNIYAEGWTGGSTALVKESGIACPAADPFYYEEKKDKDLLTTLRYSTGYLRLVELTFGALDDMAPTDMFDRYVEVLYNGTLVWMGYIQTQEFTTRFGGNPYIREFPVVSPLGLADEIDFDTIEPPRGMTFREIMGQVVTKLSVTIEKICTPDDGPALDAMVSSLAISPFNSNCTFARDNTEARYKPNTLGWFLGAVCTLYGWTLRESRRTLIFSNYNYEGNYIAYTVSGTTVGERPTDAYTNGNTSKPLTMTNADSKAKLSVVKPLKEVIVEYDGEEDMTEKHNFNLDEYSASQGTNFLYAYLKPYGQAFSSQLMNTSASSNASAALGTSLLVYGDRDSVSTDIVYGYSSTHTSTTIATQGFFNTYQGGSILKIKLEWGPNPDSFGNEALANDINLSVFIYTGPSLGVQPTAYLRHYRSIHTWQSGGYTIPVTFDKETGEIKLTDDQWNQFFYIPPTATPFAPIFVRISSASASNLSQAKYYKITIEMTRTREIGAFNQALYSNILQQTIPLAGKGESETINQPISDKTYASLQVHPGSYTINPPTLTVLSKPQNRYEGKFRIASSRELLMPYDYMLKIIFWKSNWRWRIIAVKFAPWEDEYTVILHRSTTIE